VNCAESQPYMLEGREIVKMPGNRHFDQVHGPAPAIFFGGGEFIADTAPIRRVIAAHQAALVFKAIFQKQRHRRLAVVPTGRAVTDRPHARDPVERLKAALQHVTLLLRRQHCRVLVDPTVVVLGADFRWALRHLGGFTRIGVVNALQHPLVLCEQSEIRWLRPPSEINMSFSTLHQS